MPLRAKSVELTRVQLAIRHISPKLAETPFEVTEGFNKRWWNRIVQGERLEWSSFLDVEGTEAARADADEFWGALGWQRHNRPDRNILHYRPLFVSPAAAR
jgi:hypothetical protein